MSDLNFTINADTSRARSNLDQLERRVGSVGDSFGRLKGAIGGLIAAASIKSLFDMSNALADLSATTNVSIQSISGLGEALARNSGNFNQAQGAILRFTETLGGAIDGSDKTREAFARVGVSLDDLRNLSEQDLLRKTILGLGQVTDVGVRASLTAELFGKSLRGADLAGVARDLDRITAGQGEFARAAETAGAVNQSLQNSFRVLQNQVLQALEPFAKFLEGLLKNEDAVKKFIQATVEIGAALTVIAGSLKALQWIGAAAVALGGYFTALKANALALGTAVGGLITWFKNLAAGMARIGAPLILLVKNKYLLATAATVLAGKFAAILIPLGKLILMIGGAVGALYALARISDAVLGTNLSKYFEDAYKSAKNFVFGVKESTAAIEMQNKVDAMRNASRKAAADARKQQQQRELAESDKAKKLAEDRRKEEDRIAQAFRDQLQTLRDSVDIYARGNADAQRRLKQEIDLIGLTEQQKTMKQSLFDLEENYLREVTRLTDLYAEKSRSSKEEDRRLLPEIQTALQNVTAEYERQLGPVMALTQEKLQALEVEKQRLEVERQVQNFSEFANRSRLDGERKIRDLQREIAMSTMTDLERKYADIAIAADESARSAIESENARRKAINQPLLTSDEQKKYYEAANEGISELIRLTQQNYEQSREWGTGWGKAFKDYVDSATNAASQAERLFKKSTQGMEDAIVNFAKTGKFEFKNFVNMVLEELLRIQIQKTFAQLMSGGSSTIGSSVGRLLGFANGGIIPTDRPVLVGERGPELLVGASGNRVIPNDQLPTGANVTYNINAVDASSFKELLARDPSFLYAVTEQGRRRAPGTRR